MGILLIAGYVIGLYLSHQFRLPSQFFDLSALDGDILGPLQEYGFVSASGWARIMLTNLRAIVIATVLGIFSFGVLGLILFMAPMTIVGFISGNLSLAGQDAGRFITALILPHGILEVPLTIVAGAALLEVALSVVRPKPGMSLGESALKGLAEWARLTVAVGIPLLIAAAGLEVFVTPRVAAALLGGG
jgi:uncharacterized membrane protein SpoIIM required for sporulation